MTVGTGWRNPSIPVIAETPAWPMRRSKLRLKLRLDRRAVADGARITRPPRIFGVTYQGRESLLRTSRGDIPRIRSGNPRR